MKDFLKIFTQITIINYLLFIFAISYLDFTRSQNKSSVDKKQVVNPVGNKLSVNKVDIKTIETSAPTPTLEQTNIEPTTPVVLPTNAPSFISQVPQHNKQSDCWVTYSGHAYNITSFFGSHAGGDNVLVRYCGQDITQAYNTKDKNPEKSHSSEAGAMLQQYLIE